MTLVDEDGNCSLRRDPSAQNFWAAFAAVAAGSASTVFMAFAEPWQGLLGQHLSWESIAVTTLWTALFVMSLRLVRAQYGPLLRSYPLITGGPSYSTQLALSAVGLSAIGAAILYCANPETIGVLFVGVAASLTTGGFLLLSILAVRLRPMAYRTLNPAKAAGRLRISFARRELLREFLFLAALWSAIGLMATGLAAFFSQLPGVLWFALGLLVVVPSAVFQAMPHALLRSDSFVRTPRLNLIVWLRDLAAVFVLDWILLASLACGFEGGVARLVVVVPALLGLSAIVALKIYEIDGTSALA